MRRTLFAVLFVVAAVVGIPAAAHAAPDGALNRRVSGVVAGTGTLSPAFPRCGPEDVVFHHFDLTIDTISPRDSLLSIDICIFFASCIPIDPIVCQRLGAGTFTLTGPSGATLTGVVGVTEVGAAVNDMQFSFIAASGTRGLRGVTGTMLLTGTWGPLVNSAGTLTGTLTTNLTR
jgi:hypothetical protein